MKSGCGLTHVGIGIGVGIGTGVGTGLGTWSAEHVADRWFVLFSLPGQLMASFGMRKLLMTTVTSSSGRTVAF